VISLQNNDVRGTVTAAFLHDIKLDLLALAQGTISTGLRKRREVNEHVVPTLGPNETVAFFVVEELDNTNHPDEVSFLQAKDVQS